MNKRTILLTALCGIAGPALCLILNLAAPDFVFGLEAKTVDLRTRLLGPATADPRVVIIGLDDESEQRLGKYPWPRGTHARLIRRLSGLGAASIAYDIYMPSPAADPAQDLELSAALAETGKVVFAFGPELSPLPQAGGTDLTPEAFVALQPFFLKLDPPPSGITPPFVVKSIPVVPDLISKTAGVGQIAATKDSDLVFRRLPLVVRVRDRLLPALGLAALRPLKLYDFDKMSWSGHELFLPSRDPSRGPDLRIPLDPKTNLVLNWTGAWNEDTHFPTFSAHYLLDPTLPPDVEQELKKRIPGAICFIGSTNTASKDLVAQPFDRSYPGVGVHAHLAQTLLRADFRTASGPGTQAALILVLAAMAIGLGFIGRPWLAALAGALVFAGYPAFSLLALSLFHSYLALVLPSAAFLLSFGGVMTFRYSREYREARFMREHFKNVLPPAVLQQLRENPQAINQKSERRELSILFSDIKGFTKISDQQQPEVVYAMLTEYFEVMTEIIFKHAGTIDKFMGDGILAFWGAPLPSQNHARDAVTAAVEMQAGVRSLNRQWEEQGRPTIAIRIGVNTGYVNVGFFGSNRRREYTILGSDVNLGQRLESNCRPGHVLVSKRTAGLIKPDLPTRCLGSINLKGFAEPVEVFEIECSKEEKACPP